MFTLKNILVAHDFSSTSRKVMDYAIELAHESGAAINFLHVEVVHSGGRVPSSMDPSKAQALRAALKEDFEASIEAQNIDKSALVSVQYTVVQDTAPAPAIISYSRDYDIDFIVMGTTGRRGLARRLIGSVAEEVVRLAPCPVLTAGEHLVTAAMLDRMRFVLVPMDFSEDSKESLRLAREIAALHNAHIELIHVVEQRSYPTFYEDKIAAVINETDIESVVIKQMKEVVASIKGPAVDVRFKVLYGHPVKEIIEHAAEKKDALLVISTHGLTGFERTLMGSVAERVVRMAPVPVITVKHPKRIAMMSLAAAG